MTSESAWFKSSYSGGTGDNCVEVADLTKTHGAIGVRDSKDKSGPALLLSPQQWQGLLCFIRSSEADLSY